MKALDGAEPTVEEPFTDDEDIQIENDPEDPEILMALHNSQVPRDSTIPHD